MDASLPNPTPPINRQLPLAFILRRLHSLTGLFLVLFLIEHLVTNSQAALWIGDDGAGFVRLVNAIHSLPYLHFIELSLLATPILLHGLLGLRYLKEGKSNSFYRGMDQPYMPYARSRAYSWQRITAWVLLLGLLLHVIHLRVLRDPILISSSPTTLPSTTTSQAGLINRYIGIIYPDEGLFTLSDRLGVDLWTSERLKNSIEASRACLRHPPIATNPLKAASADLLLKQSFCSRSQDSRNQDLPNQAHEDLQFALQLQRLQTNPEQILVSSPDVGRAMLLVLRDAFKNPWTCALYTLFLLAAVFHSCHGAWSGLIKWAVTPTVARQNWTRRLSYALMGVLTTLGLCAIWLSYWINLVR